MYTARIKRNVWRVRFPANKQLREVHYHYAHDHKDFERAERVGGKIREVHFHFKSEGGKNGKKKI